MDRTILHCDMNGFFASVELLSRPDLVEKPMAVCGNPNNRHGIILAKNDLAKAYGIVTAETVWQAKKKCGNLVLVRPHHEKYALYSKMINEIYERYTDMVEPFSIDESWLDVTGSLKLFGSGKDIADHIRETIFKELGLTLSVGVSFNKIFAKMGSEYKKPNATTVIGRNNFKKILWPMPVDNLFFAGKKTVEKLNSIGIITIGDLALADRKVLTGFLGKMGGELHDYASGVEASAVNLASERRRIKSVGNGVTFKRDIVGEKDLKTAIASISDTVASRLRQYQMKCCGVKLDIKNPYFSTISRQMQVDAATNLGSEISKAAFDIIKKNWKMEDPIRMLTITGIGLVDENENVQISLFAEKDEMRQKSETVERTLDKIRGKYGDQAITFGGIINNDIGIELYEEKEGEEL